MFAKINTLFSTHKNLSGFHVFHRAEFSFPYKVHFACAARHLHSVFFCDKPEISIGLHFPDADVVSDPFFLCGSVGNVFVDQAYHREFSGGRNQLIKICLTRLDLIGKTVIFIDCLFLMVVNIPFFSVLRSRKVF